MAIELIPKFLPENCYGRQAMIPEGIICHYISAIDADKVGLSNANPYDVDVCVEILKYYKFSAHVLIARDGRVYQCVPFRRRAWHAGESLLNGRQSCNNWCLSIEFISTGKPEMNNEPPFTEAQIVSGINLIQDWKSQYNIKTENIAGHIHIRDAAIRAGIKTKTGDTPAKKHDPGPHFPWERILAA